MVRNRFQSLTTTLGFARYPHEVFPSPIDIDTLFALCENPIDRVEGPVALSEKGTELICKQTT